MYIDIGVNVSNEQMQPEQDWVASARAASVIGMLCLSTDEASVLNNVEFVRKYQGVFEYLKTTYGLHPHQASHLDRFVAAQLKIAPECALIGEVGLDYERMISGKEDQRRTLEYFLQLARQEHLGVVLHERGAHEDLCALWDCGGWESHKEALSVVHCFWSGPKQAKAYLERGLMLGISGLVYDERRNSALIEALQYIPLESMVIETDSPYLKPRILKQRSRINVPSNVRWMVQAIAKVKGIEEDVVCQAVRQNAQRLMRLKD